VSFGPDVHKASILEAGKAGFLGEGSDGSLSLHGATETTAIYIFSIEPAPSDATPTF